MPSDEEKLIPLDKSSLLELLVCRAHIVRIAQAGDLPETVSRLEMESLPVRHLRPHRRLRICSTAP